MMNIKIFLACSGESELQKERNELSSIVTSVSKKFKHLNLEVVKWETDLESGSYQKERIQDEINPLIDASHIVIVIFFSKIGRFTLEEYNLAVKKKKKVFLYFKQGFAPKSSSEGNDYLKVLKVREEIKKENKIFFRDYEAFDKFELFIHKDLEIYLNKAFPTVEKVGIHKYITPMPAPKYLTALPPRTVDLVGRDVELKRIDQLLGGIDRVLLVSGMGGVGKSELCKRYLWHNVDNYEHLAWVDIVENIKESFVNSFNIDIIGFRKDDTIEKRFDKIIHFLNNLNKNTLLIVDNIENPDDKELDKIRALPVKVIANSRLNLEGFEPYVLEFLSPEMCKILFYKHYRGRKDDEYVANIVDVCGKHTLTVELLAKTAQNAALQVQSLYKNLKEKGFNLNDVIFDEVDTFRHKERECFFNHLLMVFDLSNVTEDELYVLTNLSVLPPIYIPNSDFREWMALKSNNEINKLINKGWLNQDEEFNIFMHQVIQEVIRHKTIPNAEKCKRLIISLAQKLSIKFGDNPLEKKRFIIHAESLLRYIDEHNKYLATLKDNLSLIYLNLAKPLKALEFQKSALKIREDLLGKKHVDVAKSYNNLSLTYLDLSKLEQALEFGQKALEMRKRLLAKDHPHLAQSYNNLALIYIKLGKLEEALDLQQKALHIRERVLRNDHPDLGQSYNNLALLYKSMGNSQKALEYQEKDLKILTKVFPKEDHPAVAKSYNNLSLIHKDLGNIDEALKYQNKALKIREKILDKDNPELAQSCNNLAEIFRAMSKYEEALKYHKKALAIREGIFEKNHPSLALSYHNLAATYQDKGKPKLALKYQLKNLDILKVSFDENHRNLAIPYNNLAVIYLKQGDFNSADLYSKKAVEILQENFPEGHPWLEAVKESRKYIKEHM